MIFVSTKTKIIYLLSVSKRDSTGREPCGTETREREKIQTKK